MNPLAEAYIAACLAELDALKPGNVHRHAEGHGMSVRDFELSARVSAPFLAAPGARIGARVFGAVRATRAAVGQNTNLGIVLLCAPLAAAVERGDIAAVLADLDAADARDVFAAIALANPGGLGAAEHDVRAAPLISLRDAMAAAAERDLVARQYVSGFADVLGLGLKTFAAAQGDRAEAVYLTFLAAEPDSHIARKHGRETAEAVRRDAAARAAALGGLDAPARRAALTRWDKELKARAINPGTSADLTVATLFAASLPPLREEWLAKPGRQ